MERTSWVVSCVLLGLVALTACGGVSPAAAVSVRARLSAHALESIEAAVDASASADADAEDAQELEDELAADLPPLQATAPAPVFSPGLGSDYHSAAAAHDAAYPEPAAPPRPVPTQHVRAPAPAAAAAVPAEPTSLVATAASTASTAKADANAKTTAQGAAQAGAGTGVGTTHALTHYNEFLSRNKGFAQSLTALFKQFDRNGDGFIDLSSELPALVADNTITAQHANTLAAWDIDGDHRISENEWMMGPLYVSLLQYNPLRKAEFERLVATGGDTSAISQIFAHIAAGSSEDLPNFIEMKVAAPDASGKTEEELALEAEHEQQQLQEQAALAADDTARFAARHGRRRRKERMSNKAARAAELLAQKRPTSKHGIPSEADEHCVLCQYLVQRIQKQLYYTLQNGNDGFPADPNSEVSAKKMRQVNAQLLNRRGGKGLLRILSEDIVSDMCEADQMPELYYSACRKIDKAFPVLLDAIYFQFHSEAVCEEAKLCGKKTYFNQPSSVHLPSKSIVYNSGRGKCGLMGGARERANAFISAALCFAGSLFEAGASVAQV